MFVSLAQLTVNDFAPYTLRDKRQQLRAVEWTEWYYAINIPTHLELKGEASCWLKYCLHVFLLPQNRSAERTEQIKGPISKAQWHKLILWILARLRRLEEWNQVYDPYHGLARSPQSQFSSKSKLSCMNKNRPFEVPFVPIKWLEVILAVAFESSFMIIHVC